MVLLPPLKTDEGDVRFRLASPTCSPAPFFGRLLEVGAPSSRHLSLPEVKIALEADAPFFFPWRLRAPRFSSLD